jgi:tRNA modification GTPase
LVRGKPAIVVANKVDLLAAVPTVQPSASGIESPIARAACVSISALTGQGLERLEQTIVETVLSGHVSASDTPVVTSPRHKEALSRALDHVQAAQAAQQDGQLVDLIAIDVSAAVSALGEITGQTASEDLVETIFSTFCIGK